MQSKLPKCASQMVGIGFKNRSMQCVVPYYTAWLCYAWPVDYSVYGEECTQNPLQQHEEGTIVSTYLSQVDGQIHFIVPHSSR